MYGSMAERIREFARSLLTSLAKHQQFIFLSLRIHFVQKWHWWLYSKHYCLPFASKAYYCKTSTQRLKKCGLLLPLMFCCSWQNGNVIMIWYDHHLLFICMPSCHFFSKCVVIVVSFAVHLHRIAYFRRRCQFFYNVAYILEILCIFALFSLTKQCNVLSWIMVKPCKNI